MPLKISKQELKDQLDHIAEILDLTARWFSPEETRLLKAFIDGEDFDNLAKKIDKVILKKIGDESLANLKTHVARALSRIEEGEKLLPPISSLIDDKKVTIKGKTPTSIELRVIQVAGSLGFVSYLAEGLSQGQVELSPSPREIE